MLDLQLISGTAPACMLEGHVLTELSDLVAKRMADMGLTQTKMAADLHMSQQALSAFVNGEVTAPRKWREISDYLGIDREEFRQLMLDASSGTRQRLPKSVVDFLEASRGKGSSRSTTSRPPAAGEKAPNATIQGSKIDWGANMLPVLGQAVGGSDGEYIFNGTIVDYVPCPPPLVGVANAYALYVDGESMAPRYRPGETVWAHPGKPPRRFDDVVVQIKPDSDDGSAPRGYIKEFVAVSGSQLVLRQHNPDQEIRFNRDDVISVHPIVFASR